MSKQKPRFIVLAALIGAAFALASDRSAFSTPRPPLVVISGRATQLPSSDSLAAAIPGCGSGSAIQSVASNGSAVCVAAGGSGTVTTDGASIAGTGSAGSPLHTTIGGACGADRAFVSTNGAGLPTCSVFFDAVGSGLLASSNTVSADTTYVQARVTGTCGTGQHLTAIDATGASPTCVYDTTSGLSDFGRVDLSPSTSQNDYDCGLSSVAATCRVTPSANIDITGLLAGGDGRAITIENRDISHAITLKYNSTSSSPANRIITPNAGDWIIAPGAAATLLYDGTSGGAKWYIDSYLPAAPPAALTGGVTNATPVWTSSSTIGNGTTTDNGTTFKVGNAAGTVLQESGAGPFNDYPLGTATMVVFTATSGPTVTGFAGGVDGRWIYISFTGSNNSLALSNESASSSAGNRVHGAGNGTNNVTNGGGGMWLVYDGTASRWRPAITASYPTLSVAGAATLNGNTTMGGALTVGGVTVVTGSNIAINGTSHIVSSGTNPTLSTCGTSPTIAGGDLSGTIVTGTGATACTATFSRTFTTTPTCLVNLRAGGSTPAVTSLSATAITFTASASATYDFICMGH